jgi:hypothetical protein
MKVTRAEQHALAPLMMKRQLAQHQTTHQRTQANVVVHADHRSGIILDTTTSMQHIHNNEMYSFCIISWNFIIKQDWDLE